MGNGDTLTFLFTDIEGSSRLWERSPSDMEVAVARHENLLGAAIDRHAGRVVKTLGDGVYAVFSSPLAGIEAAVAAMRELEAEPWPEPTPVRVRMGLHTGPAKERRGDFYGPAVNRAARIANAAHAGQILLSSTTTASLNEHTPSSFTMRPLGQVALRGLATPERIVQVVANDLETDFPPLRGTDVPSNLSERTTSYVGGDRDRKTLGDMIRREQLVTITATGGSGKTRLAVETAARATPFFPDGVWFVDLSGLPAGAQVAPAVAATLGVSEFGSASPLDAIVARVGGQTSLLILDNCEHVIESAAEFAERVVAATKESHILATSRRPLLIAGEVLYLVAPLASTDPSGAPGPAVRLFVDRTRAVRHDFAPTEADMSIIVDICTHLDGIPLAIELAAARMRLLDSATLLARLEDRFALLVDGSRTAADRQRTLRGAVDWSYDLLADHEQIAFVDLSIVASSFTLEAAEAIISADIEDQDPLDLIATLVDNSLLRSSASVDELRFEMLESLRQYGEEVLTTTDRHRQVMQAFAGHYARCVVGADERLKGADQALWQQRYAADEPNLRKAIDWLVVNDPTAAIEMASELGRFWYRKGAARVGRDVMAETIETSPEPTEARALALGWLGFFSDVLGERAQARRITEQTLELGREVDSPKAMSFALNGIGGYESDLGRRRSAANHWRESIAMLDRTGSPWVTPPLFNLGKCLAQLGDYEEAAEIASRLEGIARRNNDPWTLGICSLLRAYVAHGAGDGDSAHKCASAAVEGFETLGAVFHAVEARILLSQLAEEAGDVARARDEWATAELAMADTAAFDHDEAHILRARLAFRSGDQIQALEHLGRAVEVMEQSPNWHSAALVLHEVARLASAKGDHDAAVQLLTGAAAMRGFDDETPTHAHLVEAAAIRALRPDTTNDAESPEPPRDVPEAIALMRAAIDQLHDASPQI